MRDLKNQIRTMTGFAIHPGAFKRRQRIRSATVVDSMLRHAGVVLLSGRFLLSGSPLYPSKASLFYGDFGRNFLGLAGDAP